MTNGTTIIHDDRALPALTGIRFLAALAVVISHYTAMGLIDVPDGVIRFLDGGRTAVSLFFVLSGFVLAYNYDHLTGRLPIRNFWVNRFARLYPGVVLGLLIGTVGVGVAIASGDDRLRDWYALTGVDAPAIVVSFIAQATMTTGWFPFARINQPWNGPAWSIACEVFFYALFPLLIVWLRRLSRRGMVTLAVVAMALQALWIVGLRVLLGERAHFLVSQFPVTHLTEFVIGMLAGLYYLHGGRAVMTDRRRRVPVLLVAVAGLVTISAWQPVDPVYLLMTPFFAAVILALAAPGRHPFFGAGPLLLLGEASYGLYILHMPVGHLLEAIGLPAVGGWIASLGVIGLSVVVFLHVERPANMWIRRRLSRPANGERAVGSDRESSVVARSTAQPDDR